MKTKSIFIILTIFTLCMSASLRRCICDELQNFYQSKKCVIVDTYDVCDDCGHLNTCCANQADSPSGVSSPVNYVFVEPIDQTTAFQAKSVLVERSQSYKNRGTRAPPFARWINAYTLNQQLLV